MKNYKNTFRTLAVLLTIISVSCCQEENVIEQKAVAKSNVVKSARATYNAEGNLYIDNQTDLNLPVDLLSEGNYFDYDPTRKKVTLEKNFIVFGHEQIGIIDMNSPDFAALSDGSDWYYNDLSNFPTLDYGLISPADALSQFGFIGATGNTYSKWSGIIKTHLYGRVTNPNL